MSQAQGNDQNGDALREAFSTSHNKEDPLEISSHQSIHSGSSNNSIDDKNKVTDTELDISFPSKSHSTDYKSQTSQSVVTNENQVTEDKVNKLTNENDHTSTKSDQEEPTSHSRELKSLLALSKEANLDTNLSRKRKSLGQKKKLKSDSRYSPSKYSKIQYPVTAESELEMELQNTSESKSEENISSNVSYKAAKRKKSLLSDASGDSFSDETIKRSRKAPTNEVTIFKPNKDMFCWRCHKDTVNIACETCPRSYHQKCLKQIISDPEHWPCPECVSILKAESTQTRSPAMKGMTLEHLCSLLKFAVNRMIQCQGSEPFIHAVNDVEFPEYKEYIIQPMDLTLLEKNIKENLYGSTQAFEADAKWILHNSIVFNSYMELSLKSKTNSFYGKKYQSKLTTVARFIIKICKQEMAEIENCPTCYLNANTKKSTWFVEVCPKPHLLVWAKLRGFPYWPGKAMSCKDGMVDVRFFGAHDRAWVPEKECFLYTPKDPNCFRIKRADIEQCVEELEIHVENLKKIYGEFNYPAFKTPLDPDNELKQLQTFLPKYKSYFNKHKSTKRQSEEKEKTETKEEFSIITESKHEESKEKENIQKHDKEVSSPNEDESMEGYGTDDENIEEINTEVRKHLMKNSESENNEKHEAEEDDTQVPSNIEPDKSGAHEVILTKGALKSFPVEETNETTLCSENSNKRPHYDESAAQSNTKIESGRVSDKISRVDISENMEISLGNDERGSVSYSENISSSNSECSSDFSVEIKKKPIQVDVDNAEFTISPASKLKMSDKLIQRLSDKEDVSLDFSSANINIESALQVKRNLNNDKLPHTTKLIEKLKEIVQHGENVEPESSVYMEDPVTSSNDGNAETSENINKEKPSDESQSKENHNETKGSGKIVSDEDNATKSHETVPFSNKEVDQIHKDDTLQVHRDNDNSKTLNQSKNESRPIFLSKNLTVTVHKINKQENGPKDTMTGNSTLIKINDNQLIGHAVLVDHNNDGSSEKNSSFNINENSDPNRTKTAEKEAVKQTQKPIISFKIHPPQKSIKHSLIKSPKKNEMGECSNQEPDSTKTVEDKVVHTKDKNEEPSKTAEINGASIGNQDECEENVDKVAYKNVDEEDAMDTLDESELNIDKEKIINIIHSSLSDNSNSPVKHPVSDKKENSTTMPPKRKLLNLKKRKLSSEDAAESQNKMLKLINIESILNTPDNTDRENKDQHNNNPILKKSLQAQKIVRNSSTQNSPSSSTRSSIQELIPDDVKSEPDSETEPNGVQDLEAKKKYLSALNILEKGQPPLKPRSNEIRTRSKTEERREKCRIIDNMKRVIEDVAVNYSANHEPHIVPGSKSKIPLNTISKADNCEIFVKSFAKIIPEIPEGNSVNIIAMPSTKQKARKSFPQPNYSKPVVKPSAQPTTTKELPRLTSPALIRNEPPLKAAPQSTSIVTTAVTTITTAASQLASKVTVSSLQPLEGVRSNGYLILQPPQQENLLLLPPNPAINYASSIASQVVSVTPCLVSAPSNTTNLRHLSQTPTIWTSGSAAIQFKTPLNLNNSQNYIPQGERPQDKNQKGISKGTAQPIISISRSENSTNATLSPLINTNIERSSDVAPTETERPTPVEPEVIAETPNNDEFGILNSLAPENVVRVVSEIIKRPPPRLKPRPPGMLSQQFSEGPPSSAGPVTARINSISHRLGDYFRGMLIETLEDLGKSNNPEATIASLKLDIEALKHKHSVELSGIEKNMCTILKDIQRSIIDDREKVIEETRAACEAETIKRIEDAKSKQWCANCSKEAQFYCCWNTSYCDYPCQQKHWSVHMTKCTQNLNQSTLSAATLRPNSQQLILRPANPPPKGGLGRVFTKPIQKVYMNRTMVAPKTITVQTSAGNILTMMETTPGNYQLLTNSLVRSANSLTNIKTPNMMPVTSSSSSNSTGSQHKNSPPKQPPKVLSHSIPV